MEKKTAFSTIGAGLTGSQHVEECKSTQFFFKSDRFLQLSSLKLAFEFPWPYCSRWSFPFSFVIDGCAMSVLEIINFKNL